MAVTGITHAPGETLKALAREAIRAFLRDLAAARVGGTVHEPRKRLKYLRSLLNLLRFAMRRTQYREAKAHLRKAAERLADLRRAEAHGEATAKLRAKGDEDNAALAELDAVVARAHASATDAAVAAEATAAARLEIEALRRELAAWSLPRRDATAYLKAMRRAYARARRGLIEGLVAKDVVTLHEARKSVIYHLHHLETLEKLRLDLVPARTGELAKLRTALGDLNDLEELRDLVADKASAFSSPELRRESAEAIRLGRKALFKRIRKRVRRLFAERPSRFERRVGASWLQD